MSPVGEPVAGAAESFAVGGRLARVRTNRPRSDRSLIAGALAGAESDVELLFRRHWPRAYRAAFMIVQDHAAAEDVAQEAFVAAVRRLDRFDRRRPFGPWLGAIVANRAIDLIRARSARRETAQTSAEFEQRTESARRWSVLRRGLGGAGCALAGAAHGRGDALRARVHPG